MNVNIPDRFLAKINKTDGCWIWTAAICKDGYGRYVDKSIKRSSIRAHRLMWTFYNGEIPKGMVICHKCDIRICVNPDHLFVGTNKDNMDDMAKKKRRYTKLSESDVMEIREKYKSGLYTKMGLSREYKVSDANICDLINRKTWRNVL